MLDNTDRRILDELSKNSRITMKELGKIVHLTGPAVLAKVVKFEESGNIEGDTIKVNQTKMGYMVRVNIHILQKNKSSALFIVHKKHDQYITNNYKVSGESCYLLECKFPSNVLLDEFLTDLSTYVSYKLSIVIS